MAAMSKRRDTIALPAVATPVTFLNSQGREIQNVLKLRQFSLLSTKHKNEKLDAYYLLRD